MKNLDSFGEFPFTKQLRTVRKSSFLISQRVQNKFKPINFVVDKSLKKKKVLLFSNRSIKFFVDDNLFPSASIGFIPIVGGKEKKNKSRFAAFPSVRCFT